MTTRTRIPAAAPAWVGSLVAGPDRVARVVHRGLDAVYLEVDGSALGILSTAATAVPCALRTGLAELPAAIRSVPEARVGSGRVAVADSDVVVGRTVDTSVPRITGHDAAALAERLELAVLEAGLGGRLDSVRAELPEAALGQLAAGRPEAVPGLLGRGSGLTPVGDDVLAGWVATGVGAAALDGAAPVLAAVAAEARARTTLLSATLLDCARRGDVLPEFRRLLLDLVGPADADVAVSAAALLRVGHTSGAGLLLGALTQLRRLTPRSRT